ncbi:MAG TPA: hypothetical protein PK514_05995 [Spirochaetota bacterium]|nr:hypothetical protein [Spirochaetota bacterium]
MYPIQKYLLEKMKEQGIRKSELVKRAGYGNISRGCKRFDDLINGRVYNKMLIDNLHLALGVTKEEVDKKLLATKLEITREIEEEKMRQSDFERRSFVLFLFCHTEQNRPSSIWLCAMLKADMLRIRRLPLYINTFPVDMQSAAIKDLIAEILNRNNGEIPLFGKIICFTVKRFYDDIESEREVYDLQGNPIPDPPDEYRQISMGKSMLTWKGRDLQPLLRDL